MKFAKYLIFMFLLSMFQPVPAWADDYYMGRHGYDATRARQQDMDAFSKNMAILGAIEHDSFWTLRLGLVGGLNYNEETPYLLWGDGQLMGRFGVQFSGGFYGVWPMGDHSGLGIGVLITQELGGGKYLNISGARAPFIGNTSLDFIFPIFFNARAFMELVIGMGVAYSDGDDSYGRAPYIYNSPSSPEYISSGAAMSVKFGLNIGGYFSEHVGFAVGLTYELFMDDFKIIGQYHYDTYLMDPDVGYRNSLHNFLPSINLLIR